MSEGGSDFAELNKACEKCGCSFALDAYLDVLQFMNVSNVTKAFLRNTIAQATSLDIEFVQVTCEDKVLEKAYTAHKSAHMYQTVE